MDVDIYDDPILEEYWNWFSEDDVTSLKLCVKIVAVPTGLFLALQVFNYLFNKKV